MAMLASLEDMVRAIAGSVMNAQYMVEKAQMANLATFFDRQNQPTSFDLQLPAIHSHAEPGETYTYRLPLISLVPHSSLVIGEAEVELDVELGALEEAEPDAATEAARQQAGLAAPPEKKASLRINPESGGIAKKNGNAAHIRLKLVSAEKSEGMARLLNDVVKAQGYTPMEAVTADEDEAPANPEEEGKGDEQ
ncbi:DUF2589 domain-containing protein [Duganella sp. Root1480D1]|uniref:DUF2589 domain-containing protein n=1 Tax=Duganella sp. Root1480D1 TaxID=1736471 RepID=UPI0009E79407|nr:DUF2589 domain-containing protein [Duganella sp. Root1480D1]